MNRRNFFKCVALGLAATGGAVYAASDTYKIVVERHTAVIPSLPSDFEGYRIAFISDLHLSPSGEPDFLREAMLRIEAEKADLLLLGGDYIWNSDSWLTQTANSVAWRKNCFGSVDERAAATYEALREILTIHGPPDGVFAVYGNHDRWVSPTLCRKALNDARITLLVNETAQIHRGDGTLVLFGSDDLWTGIPCAAPFSPDLPPGALRVVLSHNPDLFSHYLGSWNVPFDLGLAGHTHGGQIKLPGIGIPFYNVRDSRFGEGLVTVGDTVAYTTRGLGTVLVPLRVNCPPEISVLTLTRA